jgi:hypothetical protein
MEAVKKFYKQKEIKHPNILAILTEPQQVLTIGLMGSITNHFFFKIKDLIGKLDYQLKNYAGPFNSNLKPSIESMKSKSADYCYIKNLKCSL